MLSVLRIKNLAIVDELEIDFGSGLNVMTGETGAGKSIVLKALELLMGKRADSDLIRNGETRCEVEGLFAPSEEVCALLAELSAEVGDLVGKDEFLIRRTIDSQTGRGKIYLNGSLITRSVLEHLAPIILDMTSQHQQRSLLDSGQHLRLLDSFGVSPELLASVSEAYDEYSQAVRTLELVLKEAGSRSDYFRRIAFERDELGQFNPRGSEREELEAELSRLSHVEALGMIAGKSIEILEDAEESVKSRLHLIEAKLAEGLKMDGNLKEVHSLIQSAGIQAAEANLLLSQYVDSLQFEPERIEEIRERIAEIAKFERKYGKSAAELVLYLANIEAELLQFEAGGFDEAKLRERVELATVELRKLTESLTRERVQVAKRLSKAVEKELTELNMKQAKFLVDISPSEFRVSGADNVQFLLAANVGEPARPLDKVASGGELSRILLVLKTLLNEKINPMLQVFDEVDTGIGGAVSQVVGEKLKAVSRKCQVLVVTHSPQIAALADRHLFITKSSAKDRTTTSIKLLSREARVQEIARMLAGKKVSSLFEDSARELLGFSR